MSITETLKTVGEKITGFSDQVVNYLASKGIENSTFVGRVLFILAGLTAIYVILKTVEQPIKYLIIILIFILVVSVVLSFL